MHNVLVLPYSYRFQAHNRHHTNCVHAVKRISVALDVKAVLTQSSFVSSAG